jgi:toxin YoeB
MKVTWTVTAAKQRNQIFQYWNDRNKSTHYSEKLDVEIRRWTDRLKRNSQLGRATDFKNVRRISMGHYSLFYKATNDDITVVALWDNRQDPAKLLRFLKGS